MITMQLTPITIGDLTIPIPIIQGGMGVQISTAPLAAAVANCGGAGTIASVGLGYGTKENEIDFPRASREGLRREIQQAKQMTKGVVGVNIMVALSNYEDLVRTTVEEGVDFIASGAGLPLRLPEYTNGASIKLIPIVSSSRAAKLIMKTWKKRYGILPDAFIVEGPLAGGHLGFKRQDLDAVEDVNLEKLVTEVIEIVESFPRDSEQEIPVIAAGGIFNGNDIARFIRLGAHGVQMGTRFVATYECPIAEEFKNLYVEAEDNDVTIIDSPVGMPGRAIRTKLIDVIDEKGKVPFKCSYVCLKTCDPKKVPYCIARALFNAVSGLLDQAIVFAGQNVSKVKDIVSVKALMEELVKETLEALAKTGMCDMTSRRSR